MSKRTHRTHTASLTLALIYDDPPEVDVDMYEADSLRQAIEYGRYLDEEDAPARLSLGYQPTDAELGDWKLLTRATQECIEFTGRWDAVSDWEQTGPCQYRADFVRLWLKSDVAAHLKIRQEEVLDTLTELGVEPYDSWQFLPTREPQVRFRSDEVLALAALNSAAGG